MIKQCILCLLVILLCEAAGVAQSRRRRPSSTSRTAMVTDIRQADFKNFSYPANLFSPRCQIPSGTNVKIVNSEGRSKGKCGLYGVYVSGYGDITGDNREEALVNLSCNCGIVGVNREEIYGRDIVYTTQKGRVTVLGVFQSSVSDYNHVYKSYYRDGNELMNADGYPVIEGGLVTVKIRVGTGDIRFDEPKFGVKLKYRWNGNNFVLAGKPERWRCANYDCEQ